MYNNLVGHLRHYMCRIVEVLLNRREAVDLML